MKLKIYFVLTVIFSLSACGSPQERKPMSAFVLQMKPLSPGDHPSIAPTYALAPAKLKYLDNLESLTGKYYQGIYGGIVKLKSLEGSIGDAEEIIYGDVPSLHYTWKNQVLVPQDYLTLSILSSLHHFETVFDCLETATGLKLENMPPTKGKFEIFFEPAIQIDSTKEIDKLNAAFVPRNDQFLLHRRSKVEQLPLSLNLQVVAHEFGHFVFDQVFLNSKSPTPLAERHLFNTYFMRGINEGFSDFFSYTITGSTNILEHSYPKELMDPNERNFSNITFTLQDFLTSEKDYLLNVSEKPICSGSFYCIGSIFAKSLFEAQIRLNHNFNDPVQRGKLMKELVSALSKTRPDLEKLILTHLKNSHSTHTHTHVSQATSEDTSDTSQDSSSLQSDETLLFPFLRLLTSKISNPDLQAAIRDRFTYNFGVNFDEK